jgi:hypothetical protein
MELEKQDYFLSESFFLHKKVYSHSDIFDDYIFCVKIDEKSKCFFVGPKDSKIYIIDVMGNPEGRK